MIHKWMEYSFDDLRGLVKEFKASQGYIHFERLDGDAIAQKCGIPIVQSTFPFPTFSESTLFYVPSETRHIPSQPPQIDYNLYGSCDYLMSFLESWHPHNPDKSFSIHFCYGEGVRFTLEGKPFLWDRLHFWYDEEKYGRSEKFNAYTEILEFQRKINAITPTYYSLEKVLEFADSGNARFASGEILFPAPDTSQSPAVVAKKLGLQYPSEEGWPHDFTRFEPYLSPSQDYGDLLPELHKFHCVGSTSFRTLMAKFVQEGQTPPHFIELVLDADIRYGSGWEWVSLLLGEEEEEPKPQPNDPYDGIGSFRVTPFDGVPDKWDSQGRVVLWKYKTIAPFGRSSQ